MSVEDTLVDTSLETIKELEFLIGFIKIFNSRGGEKKMKFKEDLRNYITNIMMPNLIEREKYEDCSYLIKRLEEIK